MIRLTPTQKSDVRTKHCFFEEKSEISGFGRFYSADSRFRCSIAVPGRPDFYYTYWESINLEVDFTIKSSEDLVVGRVDLPLLVSTAAFEAPFARRVLAGERDEVWYTDQREKYLAQAMGRRKYRIQRNVYQIGKERASCIFYNEGRRVFFCDLDDGLWNIGTQTLDEQLFRQIVGSFRPLPSSFFTELASSA